MHYVVFEHDGHEFPVLFPVCVPHAVIATSVTANPVFEGKAFVKSAGVLEMVERTISVQGFVESLGVGSRGLVDEILIRACDHTRTEPIVAVTHANFNELYEEVRSKNL